MPPPTSKSIHSASISEIVDALQRQLASIGYDDKMPVFGTASSRDVPELDSIHDDNYEMPDFETVYSRLGATSNRSTNLNELQIRAIRAIILERQQQLDAVEVQLTASKPGIFRKPGQIGKLRQHLWALKTKIIESQNTHKRLVVLAIWRLPTEILSLIFVFCLPAGKYLLPNRETAPLLLTRVCRRWREVAVDMPSLWCGLSMGQAWQQQPNFCYESWLKRSRGRPLSLELCQGKSNRLIELRSLLQPYINQVTSLQVTLYSGRRSSLPVMAEFSALNELTIYLDEHHTMVDVVRSLSQPPSTLRSFSMQHLQFELKSLSAFNPALWARLRSVNIMVDQPHTICNLLHLCPDLSSLSVAISSNIGQVSEALTHTKLQTLCVRSHSRNHGSFQSLLNFILFPNLREFEAFYVQPWPHNGFKAFLTRSNCPLERLIFSFGVVTTDEQRAEYVALIPSLVVVDRSRLIY